MILYHPTTGRAIEVADRDAADWQSAGWLDTEPDAAPDAEGVEDTDPDAEGAGHEADAKPAPVKNQTRGRAAK